VNTKRWLLGSLAVFVVIMVLESIVNGVLLKDIYMQTATVWRPEADMQKMMWLFWIGYLVFALMFTLIYSKGYEKKKDDLGQGLRYGLYVGVLTSIPMSLTWYVVLPIPGTLALYWTIAGIVEMLVAGAAVGFIYRHK